MLTTHVYLTGFGPGGLTRTVRVTVESDGPGIASAEVRDRHSVVVPPVPTVSGCPPQLSFDVPGIAGGQFPLFVWVTECQSDGSPGQPQLTGPFDPAPGGSGGPTEPGAAAGCPPATVGAPPSAACLAAIAEARDRRNDVIDACNRLRFIRAQYIELAVVAAVTYALAVAALAVAVWLLTLSIPLLASPFTALLGAIGLAGALVLFAAATAGLAVATVLAVQAATLYGERSRAERAWTAASERFRDAAARVARTCCPGDFAEDAVTLPTCP